jgi:hypothetical protein
VHVLGVVAERSLVHVLGVITRLPVARVPWSSSARSCTSLA